MIKALRPFLLGLAFFLAACGSNQADLDGVLLKDSMTNILQKSKETKQAQPGPREIITRAMIDDLNNNLILVEILNGNYIATIELSSRPAQANVWETLSGRSVVTKDGMLVATRGFNHDLMGADTQFARDALTRASESKALEYTRSYRHLVADNQDQVSKLECKLLFSGSETIYIFEKRYKTRKFSETCTSNKLKFENFFWVQKNNTIRKSEQWQGKNLGMILIERLN